MQTGLTTGQLDRLYENNGYAVNVTDGFLMAQELLERRAADEQNEDNERRLGIALARIAGLEKVEGYLAESERQLQDVTAQILLQRNRADDAEEKVKKREIKILGLQVDIRAASKTLLQMLPQPEAVDE